MPGIPKNKTEPRASVKARPPNHPRWPPVCLDQRRPRGACARRRARCRAARTRSKVRQREQGLTNRTPEGICMPRPWPPSRASSARIRSRGMPVKRRVRELSRAGRSIPVLRGVNEVALAVAEWSAALGNRIADIRAELRRHTVRGRAPKEGLPDPAKPLKYPTSAKRNAACILPLHGPTARPRERGDRPPRLGMLRLVEPAPRGCERWRAVPDSRPGFAGGL